MPWLKLICSGASAIFSPVSTSDRGPISAHHQTSCPRRFLVETGLKMALAPLQIGLSQSMKELSTGLMGKGSSGEGSGGLLDGLVKGASDRSSGRFSAAGAVRRRRRPHPDPSPMGACFRAAR